MSTSLTRETTTVLEELQLHSRRTDIQPVSVQSSALPTGAATSAKQLADGHKVQLVDAAGNLLSYGKRVQTPPDVNVLQVMIGPGDPISNIPVFMDFEHHQIHEGESFIAVLEQLSIGTGTVKFVVTVPVGSMPHMVISVDTYEGSCIVRKYHTATFTGGTAMAKINRNRNSINAAAITITSGVTSTNGTLFESFIAGSGKTSGGSQRSQSEIVLKSNSIYRFDVVGLSQTTQAIIRFNWYEDLGV